MKKIVYYLNGLHNLTIRCVCRMISEIHTENQLNEIVKREAKNLTSVPPDQTILTNIEFNWFLLNYPISQYLIFIYIYI